MKLQKDLREFIELLNSTKVSYVLVGGHAVAHHGYPRFTGDIDFFIGCSPDNIARVASVLANFGFANLSAEFAASAKPGLVYQLGRPPHRIDLLTSIDGVDFQEAWESRETVEIEGVEVFILSKSLLIRNKRASGRPRDIEDVRQLESA